MHKFNSEVVSGLRQELERHGVYQSVRSLDDLRVFMTHHVYSVWDFMSLIKYLQNHIAPIQVPWIPKGDGALRYFINQLVLEEESDTVPDAAGRPVHGSHFELYLQAMQEIGADAGQPRRFIQNVGEIGIDRALYDPEVPVPARYFTETTFCFIREDKPHLVAAALAMGRETIIPSMFRQFLAQMGLSEREAPIFHAYLHRHIHLDEDFHGPLSLQLLDHFCGGDPQRIREAETAAEEAVCARLRFWDGVVDAIASAREGRT